MHTKYNVVNQIIFSAYCNITIGAWLLWDRYGTHLLWNIGKLIFFWFVLLYTENIKETIDILTL